MCNQDYEEPGNRVNSHLPAMPRRHAVHFSRRRLETVQQYSTRHSKRRRTGQVFRFDLDPHVGAKALTLHSRGRGLRDRCSPFTTWSTPLLWGGADKCALVAKSDTLQRADVRHDARPMATLARGAMYLTRYLGMR